MKYQFFIILIVTLFTSCSEQVETEETSVPQSGIENIQEFVIPSSIDVKKELVIAAYYERHPRQACVIIAYNDTTKSSFKKYSYSIDSSLVVEDLITRYYNEFKVKNDTTQTFTIKPETVLYMSQNGGTGMSAEFERIDVAK